MIACIDVGYTDHTNGSTTAVSACAIIEDWSDEFATEQQIVHVDDVQPYQPGQFYRRELPCVLAVMEQIGTPDAIVIDGYVWLSRNGRMGLGAYVFEALGKQVPVIGVAKNRFKQDDFSIEVVRGSSDRPLFVTAAGIEDSVAAQYIEAMHGPNRVPTILKLVDQLSRTPICGPNSTAL